jgi:hypothetical protein
VVCYCLSLFLLFLIGCWSCSDRIRETETNSKIPHCRNSSNIQSKITETETNSKIPHCRNSSNIQSKIIETYYFWLDVGTVPTLWYFTLCLCFCDFWLDVGAVPRPNHSHHPTKNTREETNSNIPHCRNSSNIQSKILEAETNSKIPHCRNSSRYFTVCLCFCDFWLDVGAVPTVWYVTVCLCF